MSPGSPADVIEFWQSAGPDKWFKGGREFDEACRARFAALHDRAAAGGLDSWAATEDGRLALVLLLDQFSRNLYRDSAAAFAGDAKARAIATLALENGDDRSVDPALRVFLYMPFEHSESLQDQHRAVALCHGLSRRYLDFAILHRNVIQRFGRFPHRNRVLGRKTSPAEQAFLDGGGFSAGTHDADKQKPATSS